MDNKGAFILAGAVALTDMAVKSFIKEPPVKNYGFAGNTFDSHPQKVAVVSTFLTGVMCIGTALAPEKLKLPMSLILGGAVSNSADRLVRGYVVDYIPLWKGIRGVSAKKPKGSKQIMYGNISDLAIFTGAAVGSLLYITDQTVR